MQATVGRIVHYILSEQDTAIINNARSFAGRPGAVGNVVAAGMSFPAIVVRVDAPASPSNPNLQVMLDGNDSYWATSRPEGEGPGTWAWPPRS